MRLRKIDAIAEVNMMAAVDAVRYMNANGTEPTVKRICRVYNVSDKELRNHPDLDIEYGICRYIGK